MSLPLPYHFIEKQMQRVGFRAHAQAEPLAPLTPDVPFWAVGDIHGCRDLLDRLIPQLTHDPVVFVGDMIDRGPDSFGVLQRVWDVCTTNPGRFHALKGNHEQLLLDFLDDPEAVGPSWIRIGGLQTLASYGISLSAVVPSCDRYLVARDMLEQAMGPAMTRWLRHLPLTWSSGNVHVVHAGAHPARPMHAQDDESLIWGHPDFLQTRRTDGQWVVHGHVIVDAPTQSGGRLAIDTGAYATGVLTAAHVSLGSVKYATAQNLDRGE